VGSTLERWERVGAGRGSKGGEFLSANASVADPELSYFRAGLEKAFQQKRQSATGGSRKPWGYWKDTEAIGQSVSAAGREYHSQGGGVTEVLTVTDTGLLAVSEHDQ
jgi:hypothetical protein